MNNVEFETDIKRVPLRPPKRAGGLVRLVRYLSRGKIQDDKTASFVLVVLIVILFSVTIYNISSDGSEVLPSTSPHTQSEYQKTNLP